MGKMYYIFFLAFFFYDCPYLSYIDPEVLLVISSVTHCQTEFVLLTGLTQLHLLDRKYKDVRQNEWGSFL